MHEHWCDRGYFLIDPVQLLAARTSVPFFWNYEPGAETRISHFLTSEAEPVARYLLDHDMPAGVTVPIHMPHGGYATVTGTLAPGATARETMHNIADFGLLAQVFHEVAYQAYADTVQDLASVHLTARERQCLGHCADGLLGEGNLASHRSFGPNGRASLEHGGEKAGCPKPHPGGSHGGPPWPAGRVPGR